MSFYVEKQITGWEALTVSSSAIGPTNSKLVSTLVTDSANNAFFRCENADVRWRDDGGTPTASVGTLLKAGETLAYDGDPKDMLFIRVSADASVTANYYRVG